MNVWARHDADVRASEVVSEGLAGIRFRLHHAGDAVHVRVPLLGRHSVHTALGAAAVGLAEGLDWTEVVEGCTIKPLRAAPS